MFIKAIFLLDKISIFLLQHILHKCVNKRTKVETIIYFLLFGVKSMNEIKCNTVLQNVLETIGRILLDQRKKIDYDDIFQ